MTTDYGPGAGVRSPLTRLIVYEALGDESSRSKAIQLLMAQWQWYKKFFDPDPDSDPDGSLTAMIPIIKKMIL